MKNNWFKHKPWQNQFSFVRWRLVLKSNISLFFLRPYLRNASNSFLSPSNFSKVCIASFLSVPKMFFKFLSLKKINWQIEIFSFRINSSSSRMFHSLKSNNVFSTSLCLQITDFASSSSFKSLGCSHQVPTVRFHCFHNSKHCLSNPPGVQKLRKFGNYNYAFSCKGLPTELRPTLQKSIYHDLESLHKRLANVLEPPFTAAAMKRISVSSTVHFRFSTCPSTTQETSFRCTCYVRFTLIISLRSDFAPLRSTIYHHCQQVNLMIEKLRILWRGLFQRYPDRKSTP